MARRNRGRRAAKPAARRGSGTETGAYALPRQYQFNMPRFPGAGQPPHYRLQAQRDTDMAYQGYADKIASAQRMLEDTKAEDLARSADVWERYQSSIAPIGGTLAGANTAITNQMTGALGQLYSAVPTGGGIAAENNLGQVAAATGGTGQLGILANAAAAQQGMQAGYQREGAVDATDQARNIMADAEARTGELANQLADYARSMPDQFLQRLTQLRQQGQSEQMARFQMAMEYKQMLSQLASDQAWREMIDEQATREAARGQGQGNPRGPNNPSDRNGMGEGFRGPGAPKPGQESAMGGTFVHGTGPGTFANAQTLPGYGPRGPGQKEEGLNAFVGGRPPSGARAGAFSATEGQERVDRTQDRTAVEQVRRQFAMSPGLGVERFQALQPALRQRIVQEAGLTSTEVRALSSLGYNEYDKAQRAAAMRKLARWANAQ